MVITSCCEHRPDTSSSVFTVVYTGSLAFACVNLGLVSAGVFFQCSVTCFQTNDRLRPSLPLLLLLLLLKMNFSSDDDDDDDDGVPLSLQVIDIAIGLHSLAHSLLPP